MSSPCTDGEIEYLQKAFAAELNTDLPKSLEEFLKFSNGLQIDFAFFHNADYLLENNKFLRTLGEGQARDYIFFGNSGNVDRYALDLSSQKWLNMNFFGYDLHEEPLGSLSEFLGAILKTVEES